MPTGWKVQKLLVPNCSDASTATRHGLLNPNHSNYSALMHAQPKAHFGDYITRTLGSYDDTPDVVIADKHFGVIIIDDGYDDEFVTDAEWQAAESQLVAAGKIPTG